MDIENEYLGIIKDLEKNPDDLNPDNLPSDIKSFLGYCSASNISLENWHFLAVNS